MITTRFIALSLMLVPALALAQGEPPLQPQPAPQPVAAPVQAMAPPPAGEPGGGPPTEGWQLQARLPTAVGLDSLVSPGFSIGKRSGNLVLGAELGLTYGKFSTDNGAGSTNSDSFYVLQIVPMIYDDLWVSSDGRARMNVVAGLGYGRGSVTSSSNDGMGNVTSNTDYVSFLPIIAGVGGDYYLHRNFALGVELGAYVPVLLSVNSNGMDQRVSGGFESMRGILRATFVTGP